MRAKRRDTNHSAIVHALRACGYFVFDTANLGFGYPDAICVTKSALAFPVLLEFKADEHEQLTPDEVEFHAAYHGPIEIVYSPEMAVERMGYWDMFTLEAS